MGAGQALETMKAAASLVEKASKHDKGLAQIHRLPMVVVGVLDPTQSPQAVTRALVVSYNGPRTKMLPLN